MRRLIEANHSRFSGTLCARALYTQIATFDRSIPLDPLTSDAKAHFDALKFNWIGSPSNEISSCVAWKTSPIKSFEDVRHTELVVSGTAPSGDVVQYPRMLNEFAGSKFRVVMGYPGASEALLAMQRGETQGFCAWGWASIMATHPDWIANRDITPLVQFGAHKDPRFGDIPLAREVVSTPEGHEAIDLVTSPQVFARPFVAAPGVPRDRVEALRRAFDDTMSDPGFLEDAARQNLAIEPVRGAQIEALLTIVYQTPKAVVERVRSALNK